MKSSIAVIACLLYGTQAIKFAENELLSIGERMRIIDSKEQSNSDNARQLFGQVDVDSYNEDMKSTLERIPINIKFENQSGMPEKEVYQQKKVEPAPIVVAQKAAPEEEEFTDNQKIAHEAFLEEKMAQFEQENSLSTTSGEGELLQRSSKGYAEAMANKELDKIKRKDRATNNLKKLKNKKKSAVQKLQQLETKSKVENTKNLKVLDTQWDKFCLNFKKADFDKANKMWAKYNKEGADFEPLQVRTMELYQKAFKFEGVAQNEIVQDAIEELNIAQTNLNNNIKNPESMIQFIKTAQKTKQSLKSGAFSQFWEEPQAE